MKSYAFALQKGGTGKTSISVSVAVELANKGKKVVYIDCDPQGNSSSWLLNEFDHELADVLYEKIPVLECVYKSDIENLYVIPTFGVGGELKQWAKKETFPFIFQKNILPALEKHFDYCIFDTSPAFDEFEKSVFIGCTEVVPVLKLDEFSKDGWEIFTNNLAFIEKQYGIKPTYNKIILNQQDKRLSNQAAYLDAYNSAGTKFDFIVIPKDPAFEKSQSAHTIIQDKRVRAKKETLESITNLAERLM
jgi:chromosome partitioning protein